MRNIKSNHFRFLLLFSFIFLSFSVQETFACQCHKIPTPYQAYNGAASVFVGKVVSVQDFSGKEIIDEKPSAADYERPREETKYYRFAIEELFKGTKVSEVTVSIEMNMCESGLDKGNTYLIYAYEWNNSKGKLATHFFCSRNGELGTTQDDVHFLRALLKNKPEPRIYGSVQREDKDSITDSSQYTSLEGIKIVAEKGKKRFETVTDKNGLYSFDKLPDGKYKVYPVLPNKYVSNWWYSLDEINLTSTDDPFNFASDFKTVNGRNAYSEFQVGWNNQISGKVLDAEGKYLERATVRLIPIDKVSQKPLAEDKNNAEELRKDRESNTRNYSITSRPPSKYVLAVEVFAPFISGTERLRVYYPQTTNLEKAEVISLEELDKRTADIRLPNGFVVHDIEGTMVWGSGNPVEGGYVTVEKLENSEDENNVVYDVQRVENGKFKFQAFENAEYWIHAQVYQEKSKPIKIRVEKSNAPIKIVISLTK